MADFQSDTGYEKECSSVRTSCQPQRLEDRQHVESCQFLHGQCQRTARSIAGNVSSVANKKKKREKERGK